MITACTLWHTKLPFVFFTLSCENYFSDKTCAFNILSVKLLLERNYYFFIFKNRLKLVL